MTHIRKEIWLQKPLVEKLQKLADQKHWSLKRYIEIMLTELSEGKWQNIQAGR